MTTTTEKQTEIDFGLHRIVLGTNPNGKPTARLSRQLTAGPNKGQYKHIEGFYFPNEERREQWIEEKKKQYKARADEKTARKQAKKDLRDNMNHKYEVGQVLYDSWGYDQTNIGFYLITKVNEKSVEITRIGANKVPGSDGFMCCNVTPDPTNILGEPELKIIQIALWDKENPYRIPSRHGYISLYNKGEAGLYKSWYA